MSRAVDAIATLGKVSVVERHPDDGVVVIEGTIGGVHGNRLTVTVEWWEEHTPEPTP